ncbi:MAG: hypothetical protein QXS81_04785 [Candidatus Micrarchaeaceae archaeon]
MELEKMTELEYKKYREMDKIAHRSQNRRIASWTVFLVGLTISILFIYFGLHILTFTITSTSALLNYTNATVQNAHLNFTTNSSIATSIAKLSQNPPLQTAYFLENDLFFKFLFATIAAVTLAIIGYIFYYLLAGIAELIETGPQNLRGYNGIKRVLKEKAAIPKRLAEYGYTQKEIDWYFEVRSKIQELEKAVN